MTQICTILLIINYRNPSDKPLRKALKDINYMFQLAASAFWYMNGVL